MTTRGARFEDFVAELLTKLGFNIIGKRVRVLIDGNEVGEVDILAEDPAGNKYAIEVKAGKVDVNGVRQAYVNAKVLNAKPLIVARGFSNTAAETLARELGVETILLEDNVLFRVEEVMTLIETALYKALEDLLTGLEIVVRRVLPDDKLVQAVMKCDDWSCVCTELSLDQSSCGKLIQELRQEFRYGSISLLKLRVLTRLAQLLRELSRRMQESS